MLLRQQRESYYNPWASDLRGFYLVSNPLKVSFPICIPTSSHSGPPTFHPLTLRTFRAEKTTQIGQALTSRLPRLLLLQVQGIRKVNWARVRNGSQILHAEAPQSASQGTLTLKGRKGRSKWRRRHHLLPSFPEAKRAQEESTVELTRRISSAKE